MRPQRLAKQMNATVPLVMWYRRWWNKESAETRQIYIDEYLVHRILNKSETIFILILNVIQVSLYIYFGD